MLRRSFLQILGLSPLAAAEAKDAYEKAKLEELRNGSKKPPQPTPAEPEEVYYASMNDDALMFTCSVQQSPPKVLRLGESTYGGVMFHDYRLVQENGDE